MSPSQSPLPPTQEAPTGPGAPRRDAVMSFLGGVLLGAIGGFVAAILVRAAPGLRLALIGGGALGAGLAAALLRERFWGRVGRVFRWFR